VQLVDLALCLRLRQPAQRQLKRRFARQRRGNQQLGACRVPVYLVRQLRQQVPLILTIFRG
jgi:hypothetical protein